RSSAREVDGGRTARLQLREQRVEIRRLSDRAPRGDLPDRFDPALPRGIDPVVEVRDDAGVVGKNGYSFSHAEGLARSDRDDAVLFIQPRDAAQAPGEKAVPSRPGPERIRGQRLRARVQYGPVAGRDRDDGRDDGQGALLSRAAADGDL